MAIKKQGGKQINLPEVTTAQRSAEKGRIQFNTTTGLAEYYDGTQWKSIDSPPTVSSISPTTALASGVTITVTGTGFSTLGTTEVKLIGTAGTELTGTSVNVTSGTSLTFVTPSGITVAEEGWDVKVINPSSLSATLDDALDAGSSPSFATAAGSLGSVLVGSSDFSGLATAAATDADGTTVTHSIASGTIPTGTSFSSAGAWSGTASVSNTYNFTVSATDGVNTVTRAFSIVVAPPVYMTATGGTITDDGDYKVHTFTSSGNFVVSGLGSDSTYGSKVEYLVVGAGGGGGSSHAGGGGAGGYRHNSAYDMTVAVATYAVVVGGEVGTNTSGGVSSAFSIESAGGGHGGSHSGGTNAGAAGGSGGGGGSYPGSFGGGSGNSPSVSPSQGNNGGGGGCCGPNYGAGGGGGASASGGGGSSSAPGGGGNGSSNDIHGSARTYSAGGGAHGHHSTSTAGGSGGLGGSAASGSAGGRNVANNYGMGGGGQQDNQSQGVVIVRYKFQ